MLKNIELKRISVTEIDAPCKGKIVSDSDTMRMRRSIKNKVEQNEARRRAGMEAAGKFVARSL